jgi:triosephosphate isomerase (TIM)
MNIFKEEKFIVANFKQYGNKKSIQDWLNSFILEINKIELNVNVVICPSFLYLDIFKKEFLKLNEKNLTRVFIGSQNVSGFSNLENTGEISAKSLQEFATFSLVGHSERKENFDLVNLKHQQCLENQIVPIVCFYENKEVFELESCIYAFEDPKAISKEGVFREKTYDELVGVVKELESLFEGKPVLYGGSVTSKNCQMVKDLNFFKGVLVGRASLDPIEFIEIIKVLNSN